MNTPPHVILFDYYGVVGVDPLVAWRQSHGLDEQSWSQVQHVCQQSDAGLVALSEFYEQLGLASRQAADEVMTELEEGLSVNSSLLETISLLRTLQIRTGILSNSGPTLRQSLQRHGIADSFDYIFISAEIGYVKPDFQLFQAAATHVDAPAQEILFFDDRQVNVDGARAAGWQAELFIDTPGCVAALTRYGIELAQPEVR